VRNILILKGKKMNLVNYWDSKEYDCESVNQPKRKKSCEKRKVFCVLAKYFAGDGYSNSLK